MDKDQEAILSLESLKDMIELIKCVKEQIAIEEGVLTDTAVHYKEVQVQTSGAGDQMFEKVPNIVELQCKLERYKEELTEKKDKALSVIKSLKPKRQKLLMLYYFQGKSIEQTAIEMDKSYTWTWWELQSAKKDYIEEYKKQ